MDMDRKATVEAITRLIAGRESVIIPKIRDAIREHIPGQDRLTCLTIVTRASNGSIIEEFAPRPPDLRYAKALTAFVLKRDFENKPLDSILSAGTAAKVADIFSNEIKEVSDEISNKLIPFLVRSELFTAGLSAAIVNAYKGSIPTHFKQQVITALTGKLKAMLAQQIDASAIAAIKAGIGKVIVASISTPMAGRLATVVVHTLATTLTPIIIKVLSSSALKIAIAAKFKVVIVGALLGAFVNILAAKLGITTTAATFAWILLPMLVGWLAYEAYRFPRKLADSVSEAVANDMRAGFQQTSRSAAEMIVEMAMTQAVGIVARKLVCDPSISELVDDMFEETD